MSGDSLQAGNWAWHLEVLENLPSTNSELKARLKSNQSSYGSALLAKRQTLGRGRLDRSWVSPPGNIALSAVVPGDSLAYQLSLVAGLSLQRTLAQKIGLKCQIKWPNDVWVANRKLAGILCEAVPEKQAVVVGFGINYLSRVRDFPVDLQPTIATVRDLVKIKESEIRHPGLDPGPSAKYVAPEDFVRTLLDSFQTDWLRYARLGLAALLPEILENLAFLGQNVTVTEAPELSYQAQVTGLSPKGFLALKTADGKNRELVAGDVRPC